ncbi:MAG: OB-fold domain-containing protein [Candidatus Heimdallarchaeota archaeon]|nr:OB-fold domain-containing protein [Candidatus Heimdallarchaeota archaeon]
MREVVRAIKSYEEAINQNRIIGSICEDCKSISVPPRPLCNKCWSDNIDFTTVETEGKIITWTEIHIAPPTYVDLAPYTLAIVELTNGERLTGILRFPEGIEPDFGMDVVAAFEDGMEGAQRLRWIPK